MKMNPIMFVVSIALSTLAAYGFWAGTHDLLRTIGSGICILSTITVILSFSLKNDGRNSVNLKVVAGVFFVILLIEQIVFAFNKVIVPYIIVSSILLLLYFVVCYAIYSAGK